MKKIEAVIFPLRLNAVQRELQRRGIRGELTVAEVRHRDSDKGLLANGKEATGIFEERVKLELIVDDSEVEKAVNAILRHAQPEPEEEGGQIVVLEVSEIVRIGPAICHEKSSL
jgi:nitrogen regulatory protein PII